MALITNQGAYGSDQSWLASTHGMTNARTGTLDVSAFTPTNGRIPAGTPVNAAAEGAVVPYDPAAEGDVSLGFVLRDVAVSASDATAPAPILRHGLVKIARLPEPFTPGVGAESFTFITEENA